MNILAIESSCDESAAAIVGVPKEQQKCVSVLSNQVYSQLKEHQDYGGVVPEIAARAHMEKIPVVVKNALQESNLTFSDIDAVAFTKGPGLLGGLMSGMLYAKSFALSHGAQLVGVNHLEGHALTAHFTENAPFPYLLLLVSGGHCQFIHVKKFGDYELLGGTIDDAIGECFDKVAQLLELGYPGGPKVEALAKEGDSSAYNFPKPLKNQGVNFSFSGLKTSVRYAIQKEPGLTKSVKANICASFQESVASLLEAKVGRALNECGAKSFVLAGGVAANRLLTSRLQALCSSKGVSFYSPPIPLCTDNAVMIGYAAALRLLHGETTPLSARATPRWPLTEMNLQADL